MIHLGVISQELWAESINIAFTAWPPLYVSFANFESKALVVVCDNLDVELAFVSRVRGKKVGS